MKKVIRTKHVLVTVLMLALFFGGVMIGEAATVINMEPEEVSRSTATNYGWSVATVLDAAGNQYVFSSGTLFKKEIGGWSSHAVSPAGYRVYAMVVDQAGVVHVVHAAEVSGVWSYYHAECPPDLEDGVACPPSEILGSYSPYTQQAAAMVEDADGTLHLVYGSRINYMQRVQGGAWTEPVQIYPPSGGHSPYGYGLRVDPDGHTLHLAGGNYYTPYKVYYGKRTPDGTWTFETAVATEGPVWGRLGLALDGSDPYICYGGSIGSSYGPLKLASRDSAGVWTTEILAQSADLGWRERGYAADCDIFDDTLYVITTIGKPSGSGSSDNFNPHVITKALPDGTPVYHGRLGNTYGYKGDIAMAVGETVSVAWTLTPIANGYTGYVFAVYDLSTVISGNNAPVADAGVDQSVYVNDPVTLDGSGSTDPDGDPLTYSWAFTSTPAGSSASLNDPASVNPPLPLMLQGRMS